MGILNEKRCKTSHQPFPLLKKGVIPMFSFSFFYRRVRRPPLRLLEGDNPQPPIKTRPPIMGDAPQPPIQRIFRVRAIVINS